MRTFLFAGKQGFWALCILLLGGIGIAQAAIRVEADRNPVVLGEEFELVFSVEDQLTFQEPDFSPLEKQFQIIRRSSSQNMVVLNGNMTRSIQWRLRLLANTTGRVSVPAVDFGSQKSLPLTLQVVEAEDLLQNPDPLTRSEQDIVVDLQAQTNEPYVQQQVIILQRLWHAVPLHSNRASLTAPEIAKGKGILKSLGRAKNLTMNRNGKRYQVIERRYALFPQNSGELVLGRSVFEGVIDTSSRSQRFNFDPFDGSGQRVRRFSKPLVLNVKGQAAINPGGTWLPARQLSINTYWDRALDQLKPGDPVNLTIAIVADGLMAEQLPAVEINPPVGVKAYPSDAELNNQIENETVVSMRQEKWVLVPTKAGSYVLPEVRVPWWNLQNQRIESATMPSQVLEVTGGANPLSVSDDDQQGIDASDEPPEGKEGVPAENIKDALENQRLLEDDTTVKPLNTERSVSVNIPPLWLLLAAFLLLSSLLVLWLRRRHTRADSLHVSGLQAMKRLEHACHANDARAAYAALMDWIRDGVQLSPPTLDSLRKKANPELRRALDELSAVLYASDQGLWNGRVLLQAIRRYSNNIALPSRYDNALEALYPD